MPTLRIQRCSGTPIELQISDHDFENKTLRTILSAIAKELTNILREDFKRGEIKYFRGAVPPSLLKLINLAFTGSPSDDSPTAKTEEPFISLDTKLCEIDFETVRLMVQELSDEEQAELENECSDLEKKQKEAMEYVAKIDFAVVARQRRIADIIYRRAPYDESSARKQARQFFPKNKVQAQTDWYCHGMQEKIFKHIYPTSTPLNLPQRDPAEKAGTVLDPFAGLAEPPPPQPMSPENLERVRELLYLMPPDLFHSKDAFLYVNTVGPHRRPSSNQTVPRENIEHVRRGSILDWICSVCMIWPNEELFTMVWEYLLESNGTMKDVIRSLQVDGNGDSTGGGGKDAGIVVESRELGPVLTPLRDVAGLFGGNVANIIIEALETDEIEETSLRKFFEKPLSNGFWLREVYGTTDSTYHLTRLDKPSELMKLANAMWRHPRFDVDAALGHDRTYWNEWLNLDRMSDAGQIAFYKQLLENKKKLKISMFQGWQNGKSIVRHLLENPRTSKYLWEFIDSDDCPTKIKKSVMKTIFENRKMQRPRAVAPPTLAPCMFGVSEFQKCLMNIVCEPFTDRSRHYDEHWERQYARETCDGPINLVKTILPSTAEEAAKAFEKAQESVLGFQLYQSGRLPEEFRKTMQEEINTNGCMSLERFAVVAHEYFVKRSKSDTGGRRALFFKWLRDIVKGVVKPLENPSQDVQKVSIGVAAEVTKEKQGVDARGDVEKDGGYVEKDSGEVERDGGEKGFQNEESVLKAVNNPQDLSQYQLGRQEAIQHKPIVGELGVGGGPFSRDPNSHQFQNPNMTTTHLPGIETRFGPIPRSNFQVAASTRSGPSNNGTGSILQTRPYCNPSYDFQFVGLCKTVQPPTKSNTIVLGQPPNPVRPRLGQERGFTTALISSTAAPRGPLNQDRPLIRTTADGAISATCVFGLTESRFDNTMKAKEEKCDGGKKSEVSGIEKFDDDDGN